MDLLSIKLFGTDEPVREARLLTAGPVTVELDGGNLRYIRYQGHEAIRAVSYVVRDEFWGTYNPVLEAMKVEQSADGFSVSYQAVCRAGAQQFKYEARISGTADGTVRFEGKGTAVTDFLTNRTGFVVLHPVQGVSGRPVTVQHVDGRKVETHFPETIDPKQPIMDVHALSHDVTAGLRVTCTMTGDTFEMEDQRNWTDASYKTYVRPLGLPFPYRLSSGEIVEQAVEIRFAGQPAAARRRDGPITVRVGGRQGKVPTFGMALEAGDATAALEMAHRLAPLAPRFISGFFDARHHAAERVLPAFKALAERLDAALALEIVVPDGADPGDALHGVAAAARTAGATAASVAVTWAGDLNFVMPGTVFADNGPLERLYSASRAAFPGVLLGGGSFAYFTELNRKPPPFALLDFVCHTTCAIVHAADDRSVTETIECLPHVIRSGRALFGNRHYRIGPGTIGTRTSPFGSDPPPNPNNGRVTMVRRDPRQRGLLGAAWHLGYSARMCEGGVDSVVLGAAAGDYGLVHMPANTAHPWYDEFGGVYPPYHVMRALYSASGATCRTTEISAPRDVTGLAFETSDGIELWLANLLAEPRAAAVEGVDLAGARIAVLDASTFEACASGPEGFERGETIHHGGAFTLAPFAVARFRLNR
jgi:D-apionolactonase